MLFDNFKYLFNMLKIDYQWPSDFEVILDCGPSDRFRLLFILSDIAEPSEDKTYLSSNTKRNSLFNCY